jgi:hypothetical protein
VSSSGSGENVHSIQNLQTGTRPSYLRGNDRLATLVSSSVGELLGQGRALLGQKVSSEVNVTASGQIMEIEEPESSSQSLDELENIFSNTVEILDTAPGSHNYVKSTIYNPDHNRTFMKAVMEELDRLKKSCCTSNKADMGLLSR